MSYNIYTLPFFDKQLKRLIKKYPSLKNEYADLIQLITVNPESGTPLGNDCYKIRLSIASKGKGKSGGARVVTFVKVIQSQVYLLTIYDKSEQGNITGKELEMLIDSIK